MNYKTFTAICVISITIILSILAISGIVQQCHKPSSPVEELMIDSIRKENNKLIIEVNNLDSIKNVKVVEVKSLDNDSTLKLFYQLIRK